MPVLKKASSFGDNVKRVMSFGDNVTRVLSIFRILTAAVFIIPSAAKASDPLAMQVTIYRDHYGTPHIVGATEQATFFGYGYAQAQDHLNEMMLQYRDAQ